MFLDTLDELDRQIIELLIKNARMSYSENRAEDRNLQSGGQDAGCRRWRKRESSRSIRRSSIRRRSAALSPAILR